MIDFLSMNSIGNFHSPIGPDVGLLPKVMVDKNLSMQYVYPFLLEGETFAWDGPYSTRDSALSTRMNKSLGRLFVTNLRLIFWSDDLPKPHAAVFYEDIQGWKTNWMPLKTRAVFAIIGGRKVLFAANTSAVKNAERYLNSK
jgi:hypothetical protein